MSDLLVKLYTLPDLDAVVARQRAQGIAIRGALAPEKREVLTWVKRHWGSGWASECEVAFARQPVACILATRAEQILGFACYESTCRNFFGPTGVQESAQGRGTGKALLLAALHAMRAQGYAYAIVGGAGEDVAGFYGKAVGAVEIAGSTPGIYEGVL
jgi:GNAT superfamily N-acetyltransferase